MNFYISDDLAEGRDAYKKDPSAQFRGKWCDAEKVDKVLGDSEKCPVCGRNVSLLRWMEPRKIRLTNTRYPDRLVWWLSEPMVISERFREAYERDGLTGIDEFIPVEVVKVARRKERQPSPPRYFCGEIRYNTSIRVNDQLSDITGKEGHYQCHLCNPRGLVSEKIRKLILDTKEWDGSDVLKIYALGVIVSQRFYDLVQKHGFTNFNLVPIEEYRLD